MLSQEGSCTCRQLEGRKPRGGGAGFVFGWEASVAARRLFSSRGEWGSSLVSKLGLLLMVASLVAALELRPVSVEHGSRCPEACGSPWTRN